MAAACFLSRYLCGTLPYVRRHIIVNKMLSGSLNKTFLSFLPVGQLRLFWHWTKCMEGRKEMFYLTTHSTQFIYGYMASHIW